MKRISTSIQIALAGAATLLFLETASAAPFVYKNNDLTLGFRKTGGFAGNYEAVVNLGQASNYFGASLGTTVPVTSFVASQLTPGTFANLNNLSWSVFGWYNSGYGATYPATAKYTLWVTVPRTNSAVRSADATRPLRASLINVKPQISSILDNASFVSTDSGASAYNTASFVREDTTTYSLHLLSLWMGSVVDASIGTLGDSWTGGNLEIRTPGSFTTSVRSDLYEVRPLDDGNGNIVADPHTGTSGLAWYVGYFEF